MANNMTDEQIEKIAQAIAAKIGEPGGPAILGCGSASSTQNYSCPGTSYSCTSGIYECGGAGTFSCPRRFSCTEFRCDNRMFDCSGSDFYCYYSYSS
jgi:hypothetical protein